MPQHDHHGHGNEVPITVQNMRQVADAVVAEVFAQTGTQLGQRVFADHVLLDTPLGQGATIVVAPAQVVRRLGHEPVEDERQWLRTDQLLAQAAAPSCQQRT